MNSIEVTMFGCGMCGRQHPDRDLAEKCCDPHCLQCGQIAERKMFQHELICEACSQKNWNDKQAKRMQELHEKATNVTGEYSGVLFCEPAGRGDYGDGCFSGMDDLLETLENHEGHRPGWAFAAETELKELDIEEAIAHVCEDGYEDMESNLSISQALKDAVAEFNKSNERALTVYHPDYSRKVRIPD